MIVGQTGTIMTRSNVEIKVVAGPDELSEAGAAEFRSLARRTVQEKGSFTVALSGGSTPRGLYERLSGESGASLQTKLPWKKIHFFWGDERHVPPHHPDSNYRMAVESLISKVPLPRQNVHRIKGELPDAAKAAEEYELELRSFFESSAEQLPRFDLVLLGLGSDGHTASLFPGTGAIQEQTRWVVSEWVEKSNAFRITLTAPVLSNASRVIFLVGGKEKAQTLQEILQGDYRPELFPAQLVRPIHGELLWLVDRAAASLLRLDHGNQSTGR